MASIKISDLSLLKKKNNKIQLGMILSFILIVFCFFIITTNNLWLLGGFFITIILFSIKYNGFSYYPIYILITGLFIFLFQYIKIKENFYTLFKPFQPYPGTKPSSYNNLYPLFF